MPKINCRILKKNISDNNIKPLYYFTGEELFLLENFTDKIFEMCLGKNYKDNINFFLFNIETLDINNLSNAINMFPINSEKKCVLIKGGNFNEMNSDFFKRILLIFNDIPEFCTIVIHDFSENNKKNINYSNFISTISGIAECTEFKHEKSSTEKQAIIWAKKFDKVLSIENSKFLCEKCSNDFNLIKDTLWNLCTLSLEKEIKKGDIEKINANYNKKYSIFDICKSIRNEDSYNTLRLIDILISEKEDPIKIFSVISSDFIDAHIVEISLSFGESLNSLSKAFNYKGKEFKLQNAKHLCEIYDIKKSIEILLSTDILLKSSNIPPIFLIDRAIVEIFSNRKK